MKKKVKLSLNKIRVAALNDLSKINGGTGNTDVYVDETHLCVGTTTLTVPLHTHIKICGIKPTRPRK